MKKTIKELDIYISDGNYSSKYPRSEEFVEEGIPFIRGNNMVDGDITDDEMYYITPEKHSILLKGHVKAGDVLITTRGNIGQVAIVPDRHEDSNINAQIVLLRTNQETLYNRYLLWALQSHEANEQYLVLQTGTALKQLPVGKLEKLSIEVTDINKQHEIADILDKTYEVVKLRRKELQLLDDLIKARFVEMFGDPVNNEKGFVKAPMGDYMTVLTDFSSNGSYKTLDNGVTMYDEPNYAWMVRTTDLESGDMDSIKYIDESAYELLSKSKIFGGEIIMNKIGSAGKIYLMPQTDMPASLGRNAFMFRYDERINVKFLYHLLTSDYGQNEIQQYVRGAVTKTITKNDARSVLIIVPPIELQNEFEIFVNQVDKSKVVVQKALDETQILFNSLMQQYFG